MTDTITVKLADATLEQAKYYATTVLQLDIHHSLGLPKTLARIKEAFEGDEIVVPAELGGMPAAVASAAPTAAAAAATPKEVAAHGGNTPPAPKAKGDPMEQFVEIFIDRQEGAMGKEDVYAAVNGIGIRIPRGKPVQVKRKYVEVLKNSVQTQYVQNEKTQEIESFDALLYPFREL